jgi:hypothetical protein
MAFSSTRKPGVLWDNLSVQNWTIGESAPAGNGTTIVIGRVGIILFCEGRLLARHFTYRSAA